MCKTYAQLQTDISYVVIGHNTGNFILKCICQNSFLISNIHFLNKHSIFSKKIHNFEQQKKSKLYQKIYIFPKIQNVVKNYKCCQKFKRKKFNYLKKE